MEFKTGSMGFNLVFQGPDSVEEYDRLAGKAGSCLEDACENIIYRSTLPEFHEPFAKRVEEFTGITREVNTEATANAKARSKNPDNVKDIMETVPKFVRRATAQYDTSTDDGKAAMAQLQTIAQEVASGIRVDPSPAKRQGGIPKQYRDKAESILALDEDAREEKVTKLLDTVSGYELARDENNTPEAASLARLIQQYVESL